MGFAGFKGLSWRFLEGFKVQDLRGVGFLGRRLRNHVGFRRVEATSGVRRLSLSFQVCRVWGLGAPSTLFVSLLRKWKTPCCSWSMRLIKQGCS